MSRGCCGPTASRASEPPRAFRTLFHPARGMGPGPSAPPRGAALHTGQPAGPGQRVSPDPLHGQAVAGILPRRAPQHPLAAGDRSRPGGGDPSGNRRAARHRQRRVGLGGELAGPCRFKAKVTPVVPSWMVMATHGWWFPEKEPAEPSLYGVWESNINQLLPMGHQGKDGHGRAHQTFHVQDLQMQPRGGEPWLRSPNTAF